MVKTLPAGMQDDLDNGATTHCICWKLTRLDTTVMGFTDHDKDLTFDSVVFNASTGLNASAMNASSNLNVDDMDTVGALMSAAITEADISKKLYDDAFIQIFRVDHTDVVKRVEIFTGFLGSVSRGKIEFKAEVRSLSSVLNQPTGQVYQKTCNVDLFSTPCGVLIAAQANFEKLAVPVSTVFSRRLIAVTDAAITGEENNWFTGGKLTWTTGVNNGFQSEVKSHLLQTGGSEAWLDLWEETPNDISVTDEFTIQVGCDKSIATCKGKFDNVVNFRGFPRMPGMDAIITYASRKDKNDGTSWYQ